MSRAQGAAVYPHGIYHTPAIMAKLAPKLSLMTIVNICDASRTMDALWRTGSDWRKWQRVLQIRAKARDCYGWNTFSERCNVLALVSARINKSLAIARRRRGSTKYWCVGGCGHQVHRNYCVLPSKNAMCFGCYQRNNPDILCGETNIAEYHSQQMPTTQSWLELQLIYRPSVNAAMFPILVFSETAAIYGIRRIDVDRCCHKSEVSGH